MNKCPEINSKAWKALVEQVSEDTAWALWAYYGGNYPVALAAKSTIHKEIGYQKIMTEDQVIRMAKKLKAYNTANNTSHSFSKSPVRDNTAYEVTMYYSYWPKKPMTQLIEAKAFKYTNKEEGAKAFVNNHPEIYMQEGNQFFKDGEIYPSYEDALNDDLLPMTISNKISYIENSLESKYINDLKSKIASVKNNEKIVFTEEDSNHIYNLLTEDYKVLLLENNITNFQNFLNTPKAYQSLFQKILQFILKLFSIHKTLNILDALKSPYSNNIFTEEGKMLIYGITSAQKSKIPIINKVLNRAVTPYSYNALFLLKKAPANLLFGQNYKTTLKFVDSIKKLNSKYEKFNITEEQYKKRDDAWRLSNGLPQRYNTFKYIGRGKVDSNANFIEDINGEDIYGFINPKFFADEHKIASSVDLENNVMGNYAISIGKDSIGHYLGYSDRWDLTLSNKTIQKVVDITQKPFVVTGKIYHAASYTSEGDVEFYYTYDKNNSDISNYNDYIQTIDNIEEDLLPMTIKPGVEELFDSNPELANQVYETLRIQSDDYIGVGAEDLDNLIDDNLNINWDLLDKLQNELFSKEAKWTLKNRPEKHSDEKYTWEHIQNVVESAKKISIPSNVDRKTLILAALLHDIGKPYRNEDHALDSVKVINKLFKDNKYSKLVKLAVRHHMISTTTTNEEYQKIIEDAENNGIKSEDFIELLLALNIADITRNRNEDTIDNFSKKSIKDTLLEEIPLKRKALSQVPKQQKQQALQLYSQYLNSIFPNSKVKDIVYHGSNTKFEGFLEDNLNYFGTQSIAKGYGKNLYPAIIEINKPYYEDGGNLSNQSYEDLYNKLDESASDGFISNNKSLFVPKTEEQIHILGSKQDIEGFKEFATNKEMLQEEDMYPMSFIGTEKSMRPKFQALIDSYRERVKMYRKQINNLELEYKKANSTDRTKLSDRIANLERNIDKLVGDDEKSGVIEDILKLNALEDIQEYAEDQFNEVNRILSQDNISLDEKKFVQYVIDLWIKAGDFSTRENLFWTEDELEEIENNDTLKAIKLKFNEYKNRAEDIQRKVIIPMEEQLVVDTIDTMFDIDSSSILNPITKDVSSVVSEVIDASEVDNPVLQAMNYFLKTATFAAHQEVLVIEDKVDELINKVNKIDWELFEQTFSNSDSRKTGNLVFRFSQDYFDTLKELFRKARKASGANKKVYYKEALDFVKNNTLVFDVRKLFPDKELWGVEFSQEEIDAHVAELKANIGEIGYDEYLERAKEKLERYKDALAAQREVYLASHAGNSAIVDQLMQLWETNNSPAKAMEMMESTYELEKIGDKYITPTNRFVERIPLRYKNGKSTGYYDSKFEKIESDTNLRELYNYILETMSEMKQYLPYEETKWMQINSLPTIYKTVLEQYGEEGLHAGFAPLKDAFKEATRTSDISPVDKRIRNPLTGEVDKQVQTDMLIDYTAEINRLVELKVKEYNLNNETPATAEIIAEFKKDAADEVSKLKSFDLGKITKAFALMALTYKHKSSVQDVMEASSNLIKRQLEQQESAARKELLDSYGNPIPIKGLNNTRKMLNTLMDVYYGYQMDKPFGQTKKKVYTEREQALKERYEAVITKAKERLDEGKLTEDEFERIEALMNDQLDVLGGVRTWSKYGDLVLQYVQIKGMGWNVFAGVTNMLYGFVSNVTEASDGRNYNMEEFWTAQAKILSTIGGVNKFSPEAKKIRALMKNLDVLKQTRYELWKATQQGTMGKLKKTLAPLNPYNPQTSTEYINQATVMVAMLLHQKVTLNGETISLYNAYDQSGKLLDGVEFPEKIDENKVKIRIDAVISMNHGNYDPDKPINFKRNLLGRALSQFRTWAYQGFAERFMDERYSLALGISKKGRYRSYGAYYKAMSEQDYGAVMSSIYLLKQLLRKSTFGKYNTQFDQIEGLSEVDAANMRKNMTEIMFIIMLTTLALLLKASFDDGKNSKGKYIAFFWINQLTRLNTDMSFYVSPVQFEKLTKNAMPAFSLVIDVEKALDASWNYIVDPQSDILQSGSNKGDSKAARALSRLAPGPHQAVNRVKAASEQVFEDNR